MPSRLVGTVHNVINAIRKIRQCLIRSTQLCVHKTSNAKGYIHDVYSSSQEPTSETNQQGVA